MYKPNNKKTLTVLIAVAMIFSAFAILSFAAQPAYAQTMQGTVSYTPTSVTIAQVTDPSSAHAVIFANGGTFSSVTTFYFFWSTTNSFTTYASGSPSTGFTGTYTTDSFTYSPQAGSTTFTNALLTPASTGPTNVIAGQTLYLLVSDVTPLTVTSSVMGSIAFTVSPYSPTITVTSTVTGSTNVPAGQLVKIIGSGFAPTATGSASVYIAADGVNMGIGSISLINGAVAPKQYVTIPNTLPYLSAGYHVYVADPVGAEIATEPVTLIPWVTTTPLSISGAISSTLTINGYGFTAGEVIQPSTTSSTAVEIGSGIYAIQAGTKAGTNGQFTLTVTGLTSAISPTPGGPELITIAGSPTTLTVADDNSVIYVSSPNNAHLNFVLTDQVTGVSTYGYPDDPVMGQVFDFPANTQVTVTLGAYTIGTLTTDSNGFGQLPSTAVIPEIPYGSYMPVASIPSQGLYVASSSFEVNSFIYVLDPSGNSLPEYVPTNGNLTVYAYGLNPTNLYEPFDTGLGYNLIYEGVMISVSVGTEYNLGLYPAANGTLIFTYEPSYTVSSSTSTGTTGIFEFQSGYIEFLASGTTPTLVNLSNPSASGLTDNDIFGTGTYAYGTYYSEIGIPTISVTSGLFTYPTLEVGSLQSATVGNIIPAGSQVYPSASTDYSLYIGTQLLTVTYSVSGGSITSTTFPASGSTNPASQAVTFKVPNVQGLQSLVVVYSGQTISSALKSEYVVVSTPGTTYGTLQALYVPAHQLLILAGYNFAPSSTVSLYYTTFPGASIVGSSSPISASPNSYGAFDYAVTVNEPSGTYSVFMETSGGQAVGTPTTYTVTPYFANLFGGFTSVGTTMGTITAYGLQPNTYYDLLLNGTLVDQEATLSDGIWSYSELTPLISAGTYTLSIAAASSPTTTVVSQSYVVVENSNLALSTMSQYAFPGQIVQFSAVGLTVPPLYQSNGLPSTTDVAVGYEANVYLNGTLLATVPASFTTSTGSVSYLNGSFRMPNNAPGSYYLLEISGLVEYSNYQDGSLLGSTLLTTGTTPMAGSQSDFLGLAEGNGALLTGITPSEIATIEFDINSTVTKSLSVPIAQLDAAITSINGAVAELKTTVGNISVALSTINATVLSIQKGVVTLSTELGNVQTSLASVNATLVSLNGNIATLQTTVGSVQASLSALNTTVTVTSGNVANIQTSLGSLTGTVTSMNGTVATISTKLGTLTTNVTKLTSPVNTLEIFEIVIVVLVLITLVLSFLAISNVNKVAKKVEEQKKQ